MTLRFQPFYNILLLPVILIQPAPLQADSIDSVFYRTPGYFRSLQGPAFLEKTFSGLRGIPGFGNVFLGRQ